MCSEISVAEWPNKDDHGKVSASAAMDGQIVTWQSWNNNSIRSVYARILDGNGAPVLGPYLVASSPIHNAEPDVACDPNLNRCLLAWMDQYSDLTGVYGVFGRTIDFNCAMSDVAVIRSVPIDEDADTAKPAIAATQVGIRSTRMVSAIRRPARQTGGRSCSSSMAESTPRTRTVFSK